MLLGSRFLVILTGWLTVAAFSIGILSIVYAETAKTKSVKISSDQRYEKYLDGTILDKKNGLMWVMWFVLTPPLCMVWNLSILINPEIGLPLRDDGF